MTINKNIKQFKTGIKTRCAPTRVVYKPLMSFKIIFNYIVGIMLAVGLRIMEYIFKVWQDLLYMCLILRTAIL